MTLQNERAFEPGDRVRVIATNEIGTVDSVEGGVVYLAVDHLATLLFFAVADLEAVQA